MTDFVEFVDEPQPQEERISGWVYAACLLIILVVPPTTYLVLERLFP